MITAARIAVAATAISTTNPNGMPLPSDALAEDAVDCEGLVGTGCLDKNSLTALMS